jgi:hypothetical protein
MTKDIKTAPVRTKIYVRLLTSKHGTNVTEMEQAVRAAEEAGELERRAEGYTRHNSHSLNKLALTYGFAFRKDTNAKGVKEYEGATRYFFASAKNDPKLAAKAAKAKEAAKASKVRLPLVEGVKVPASNPGADLPAISAKASKASRKARVDASAQA